MMSVTVAVAGLAQLDQATTDQALLRCQFVSKLPTAVRGGADSLYGYHTIGDGRIFLKTSAPLSLKKGFQKNIISTGSISLDSTFKKVKN
jgi:hypothetical protein